MAMTFNIKETEETFDRCLTKVTKTLFTTDDPLVIVTSNPRQFETFFFTNKKRLILDVNKPFIYKQFDFRVKPNFVLDVQNVKNYSSFIEKLKLLPIYNLKYSPPGKYLIISEDKQNISEIFFKFWYEDMVKVIILQKRYSFNNNIYTASPYWKENKCTSAADKILKMECNEMTSLNFFETPKKLQGCVFIAGILNNIMELPHIGKDYLSNKPGLLIYPLRIIEEALHLHMAYTSEDYKGEFVKFGTLNQMKARIYGRIIDSSQLFSTSMFFYDNFDLTQPCLIDQYLWAMAKRPEVSKLTILVLIFHWTTWTLVWVTFLCVLLVWAIFAFTINEPMYKNILKNTLSVFGMTLGISADVTPKTSTIRILMIAYIIYAMHILSYFQGILSSVLTNPGRLPRIKHVEELANSNIIPYALGYMILEIKALDAQTPKKLAHKMKPTPKQVLSNVESFKLVLGDVSSSAPVQRTSLAMYDTYQQKIDVIGPDYLPNLRATYGLRKGHHLIQSINRVLQVVEECGYSKKWLSEMRVFSKIKDDSSFQVVLKLAHLQAAFAIWGMGLVFAGIMFFLEISTECLFKSHFKPI